MLPLTKKQWAIVLDHAKTAGLFSFVDPEELTSHLRVGGLSLDEEQLITVKVTDSQKRAELEKWLRFRPKLLEPLRRGLKETNFPHILSAVDEAVSALQLHRNHIEDADRFCMALRCHNEELTMVGEWLVPHLWQCECLTPQEKDKLINDPKPLVDVLLNKSPSEWRCFMRCLEDKHEDLFLSLSCFWNPLSVIARNTATTSTATQTEGDSCNCHCQSLPDTTADLRIRKSSSMRNADNRFDFRAHLAKVRTTQAMVTETWLEDIPPVRVALPDGRSFLLPVQPRDPLSLVLDVLRRHCVLMGVWAVTAAGTGLLSAEPGWRHRSLEESGVGPGGRLEVEPLSPRAVAVAVQGPTCSAADRFAVLTRNRAVSWTDLRTEVELQRGKVYRPVLMQVGTLYERQGVCRHSLRSFDPETGHLAMADEEDGQEEIAAGRSHVTWEFLRPRTAVAAVPAPALLPYLLVCAPAEVCLVAEDRGLVAADGDALFDPRAALLLQGLSLVDRRGARLALKLRLFAGQLVDAATGAIHEREEEATAQPAEEGATWRRVFVPLRAGDPLPRCRVPAGRQLRALTRRGLTVAVEKGRVAASGTLSVSAPSSWAITVRVCDTHRHASDAARQE